MKRRILLAAIGATFLFSSAGATTINLYEYGLNIDGTTIFPFLGDALPGTVDITGFDESTGLGQIAISVDTAGSHNILAFFDHEIDEAINTFFNESGQAVGSAPAGLSWEIDEPGYLFGDIYDNFLAGSLDGSNGVPAGSEDDVSMAMGWSFSLSSGQTATILLNLGTLAPGADFYLAQYDPDSDAGIYLSSQLSVVPEPATLVLFGSGILLMFSFRRERRA